MKVDYLQIFEFVKSYEENLIIIHRQEEPMYQKKYELKLETRFSDLDILKLWLIDDGINQTMLLPEAY